MLRCSTTAEASYKSLEFPSSRCGAMSNAEANRINQKNPSMEVAEIVESESKRIQRFRIYYFPSRSIKHALK